MTGGFGGSGNNSQNANGSILAVILMTAAFKLIRYLFLKLRGK